MHAEIEGLRVEISPGLRHNMLLEAPELVTRLLGDFLGERLTNEVLDLGQYGTVQA